MGDYRRTDTSHIATGAATGGMAVTGLAVGAGQAIGGSINLYSEHIAAGGKHVPEVLMIPFLAVVIGAGYVIGILAGVHPPASSLDEIHNASLLAHLVGWCTTAFFAWIWIALVGGIFAACIMAGKGAVFNAVIPAACAIGYALYVGPAYSGITLLLTWLGARTLCAGLTKFPAYRTLRTTALALPAAAMVIMPLYMLLASAGYLPNLSPRANALIAQVFSFESDDHPSNVPHAPAHHVARQ